MKVSVRITADGRSGVSRKTYDSNPTKAEVEAQVVDAMAQTLEKFAPEAKKARKKASKS